MILGVGVGGEESVDYERFGESGNSKILAQKLDESLEIINGLTSGKPFSYPNGTYYQVTEKTTFLPTPIQKPRFPIWVGGWWPYKGPFKRAAKWDGVVPIKAPGNPMAPTDLDEVVSFIKTERQDNLTDFDFAVIGWTTGRNPKANSDEVSQFVSTGRHGGLKACTLREIPHKR